MYLPLLSSNYILWLLYHLCGTVFCLYVWYPRSPKKCVGSPETGVRYDYKLPYGYWNLNLGLLEEQSVFLIAEPFLWPLYLLIAFFFSFLALVVILNINQVRHLSRD